MRILSFDLRCLDIEVGKLHFTGGERQFFEITKKWADMGHEVHIIGSEYTQYLVDTLKSKAVVNIYEPLKPPPKFVVDLLNIKRVVKKVPDEDFDFIYCPYELFEWVSASVLIKNKLKRPLVTSINLFDPSEVNIFPLYMLRYKTYFRNLFLKYSDLIFCVSNEIKNSLIKLGIDSKRLFTLGAGIDINAIKRIRPQEKIYDACFMGDIIPRKGVQDLVVAWRAITKENKHAKLIIIGKADESYLCKIKLFVEKFALHDNIIFTGFVDGKEKYELLKKSRIFVFPSYLESFSIAVCEALACGLPVVAYDLPSFKEHYGDCITYVEKGNIKELAKAALNLLDNDDVRNEMAIKGTERASKYSWEGVAKRMLDLVSAKLSI